MPHLIDKDIEAQVLGGTLCQRSWGSHPALKHYCLLQTALNCLSPPEKDSEPLSQISL